MLTTREKQLVDSALSGDLEGVKSALVAGVGIDARSNSGATALELACGEGHLQIIDLLLASGADVNAADSWGSTPLMASVSKGRADVVARLLAHGADANREANTGMTALILAAQAGSVRCLKCLLDAGAQPPSVPTYGKLPARLLDREVAGEGPGEGHAEAAIVLGLAMGFSAADLKAMIDPRKSAGAAIAHAQLEAMMLPSVVSSVQAKVSGLHL